MKIIHMITLLLVFVGGLHFIMGFFGIDILGHIAGAHMALLTVLIGASMVYHTWPEVKGVIGIK